MEELPRFGRVGTENSMMTTRELQDAIIKMKKEKDICILAHAYQNHDILEVAEKLSQAIGSGVTNIDELRDRCNLPVLNTEFSTAHFITKNYDLANNMLKQLKEGERKNE